MVALAHTCFANKSLERQSAMGMNKIGRSICEGEAIGAIVEYSTRRSRPLISQEKASL